jgi:hypothetical protein
MNLSDPVMAAVIGASATFVTALFQLLVNARRQAVERAAGKPASRKSGTWLAIFALMLAAAVGGYALSEYQVYRDREDGKLLRQEMQARLRDIGEATVRLERAGLQRVDQSEAEARLMVERRRGVEGVAAIIGLPPCTVRRAAFEAQVACNEENAVQASVCATVPASATVTEVQLFTRTEDAQQAWNDSKVQLGQDAGAAKFVDATFERVQPDAKEVCQHFIHWGSQKGRLARVLVKYSL